jgi:hypothetical protein
MEIGPCLLVNLTEILLRFRRWKYAITADIEKAFLQVSVRAEDRDVHRFLWKHEGQVKVMRFRRVPFGNSSSPFLLNATVQHHLSHCPPSKVIDELKQNLYVDDFLSGCDSVDECCSMIQEACDTMNQACMPLAKWGSNSEKVALMLQHDFKDKHQNVESLKVLGMLWLASEDCFSFHVASFPAGLCVTKRVVLSFFSRLFDPLGFSAPFVMQMKCLFQELWMLGLEWDEEIPLQQRKSFHDWVKGLCLLKGWKIPRTYSGDTWCDVVDIQVHGFCDASPKGYGACVYLRLEMRDGSIVISLVIAKARVAPVKKCTIPRLELLGALLCARLVTFVKTALQLQQSVMCSYWTDSMIVLSWIKSDPSRWKVFVANRVSEIHLLSSVGSWSHCPGKLNPADLLTRGVSAEELVSSEVWLNGPPFLLKHTDEISVSLQEQVVSTTTDEERLSEVVLLSASPAHESPFPVERWGSLTKALRVVGWVNRFIHNVSEKVRSKRRLSQLTFEELQSAKVLLIQQVQQAAFSKEMQDLRDGNPIEKSSPLFRLDPYLAEDGFLRVRGRLHFSGLTYAEKHPIIVPKGHFSVLLVRFQHYLMKHAGVALILTSLRNHYWVLGVRRIAKRVKKGCVACQRIDAPSCSQPMAPLPKVRVNQSLPFAISGVDHAGPLYCVDDPRKKYWILLFTCAVMRGVHLELVESVSCAETLLAIRRMAARRGLPNILISDNAKGFVACAEQVKIHFGPCAPEWRFIAPRAPWWGGFWERLMRTMKSALKKSVGSRCLTRVELETTIHEVEMCLNSRPLTFMSDEPDAQQPLTPAHFLLGHSHGFFPDIQGSSVVSSANDLRLRQEVRKSVIDRFWDIWSTDYIRNLPPWKGSSSVSEVEVGSVVLIQEDNQPRLKWLFGVITELFPGKDGVIRAVKLKTATGELTRPVSRLHNLELVSGSPSDITRPAPRSESCVNGNATIDPISDVYPIVTNPSKASSPRDNLVTVKPVVTRAGRMVKPPQRLDL